MYKLIISLLISIFYLSAYASTTLRIDSIGVENNNGKKLIIHKIEPKESYYALGRKYNVSPKDIIAFNDNKALSPGAIVKVPTQRSFIETAYSKTIQSAIRHTVKPKENLGIIAEKYNTTVAALRLANNMTGSNLSIGQVLIIPTISTTTTSAAIQEEKPQAISQPVSTTTQSVKEHVVQPKEFLLKIAEAYGTTVEELKRLNNLTTNNLSIGQILKVPSSESQNKTSASIEVVEQPIRTVQTISTPPEKPVKESVTGISHTVTSGETIFSIAQKFGLTAYQVRQANNLADNTIKLGQTLVIPINHEMSVPEAAATAQADETDETLKNPKLRRDPNAYGLNQVEEKGAAVWISDPDLDATKMLVLHRTLPIGSIIKITNPMSNISTFAKVVGKFTENESTKDVIIVATKAVADSLGVLDKRFICNITYAVKENDQ